MLDDLKLAFRRLRRAPGFTLTSVTTLAVAVGANAAIFTVADGVLFRPLPYTNPDRLFALRDVDRTTGYRSSAVPYEYVQTIQEHHTGVAGVALRSTTIMTTQPGPDGAESIETFFAAPDYFYVLGVQPVRGRLFEPADADGSGRYAVLAYETWRRRFGAEESIIGRDVRLGRDMRTVIGILPPGFIFPAATLRRLDTLTGRAEFVMVSKPPGAGWDRKQRNSIIMAGRAIDAIVRLKPGVTREQAQAELDGLAASVRATGPPHSRAIVLEDLRALLFPTGRQALALLLGSAALVLLIGCANLAHMLMARTRRRQHEMAVHAALGATRLRLMRPLLLETLIIGITAGTLAASITALAIDGLLREVPPAAYGRAVIGVDARVWAFSLLLGVGAGLLFAVVPAWRSSPLEVQALIRHAHHRVRRRPLGAGRPIIAAQTALAILLVVGAVTAAGNLVRVLHAPLRFNPDSVITLDFNPDPKDPLRPFFERAMEIVALHPDVVSVGAGSYTPFYSLTAADARLVSPARFREVDVLPGYLETLQMYLREGGFPARGGFQSDFEPAVVSVSAARTLFPDGHAVGEIYTTADGRATRIIGVVEDENDSIENTGALVYIVPGAGRNPGRLTMVVRTRTRSAETIASLRRAIVALVPPTEPVTAAWLSDSIGGLNTYRNPRFQMLLFGSFAILALGLASLGVFAVVAATVATRTREMGIRLAIGAPPRMLMRQVVSEAFLPIAAGIVVGAIAAPLVGRIAQAQAAGFSTAGAGVVALAAAAVAAAGLLAAYVPARRASRVDPVLALRTE